MQRPSIAADIWAGTLRARRLGLPERPGSTGTESEMPARCPSRLVSSTLLWTSVSRSISRFAGGLDTLQPHGGIVRGQYRTKREPIRRSQ